MHEALAAVGFADDVTLTLDDDLRPETPTQYDAWLQLVLTWGQSFKSRTLHLSSGTVSRIRQGEDLSDLELLAASLATEIKVDEQPIDVGKLVRDAVAERIVLTTHKGDGDAATSSILLAEHTFTNRVSPQLHAIWNGAPAIEESARTLYHDVWPESSESTALRPAMLEFGEEKRTLADGVSYVTRTSLPTTAHAGHGGDEFVNLGSRAPRIRGNALLLAAQHRHQPKPLHDEVGEILFELIQNTQWHATRWPGGTTGANYRAVIFREYRYDRSATKSAEKSDPVFAEYVRTVANDERARSNRSLGSVVFGTATIVDSGVGLARSVALGLGEGDLLTDSTEVAYLIRALNKSLRVRRADMGNIGLPRVQQTLTNLRGFMSIRTGTVHIHRDFARRPFEVVPDVAGASAPSLFADWVDPDTFVVGPRVGTAVTIAYPVEFEEQA